MLDVSLTMAPNGWEAPMQIPRLKEWRERALLTQADLAERSGVAEVTINRIENGRHEPRFSTIRKLATALGVEPAALMAPGHEGASDD
jgi:transcriptional regulator with XRE-family HTH domain